MTGPRGGSWSCPVLWLSFVRALQLGIELDRLPWLRKLYTFDGTADFIDNFLDWDDARLTTALLHPLGAQSGRATDLFRRLYRRQLFKRVFARNLRDFSPIFRVEFPKALKSRERRLACEQEIAARLGGYAGSTIPAEHVIVHLFGLKSVREQSRNEEGSILILGTNGLRKFEDASTLFRSIDETQNDQFVQVYAPYPFHNKVDQRKLGPRFDEEIGEILEKPFQSQALLPNFPSSP
jgi:hypothetical protein